MKIGIYGLGMVGGTVHRYFKKQKDYELAIFDSPKGYEDFDGLLDSKFIFMSLPTPYNKDTGYDTSVIQDALQKLTDKKFKGTVVLKSTVLPGTTQRLYEVTGSQLDIIFNPEFLSELTCDFDFAFPENQIIGVMNGTTSQAKSLAKILPKGMSAEYNFVPWNIAETVKIMRNSFFALKVTFANQLYDYCTAKGIDYEMARKLFEKSNMVGKNHWDVNFGGYRGFGGHCLPKDTKALIKDSTDNHLITILKSADEYNDRILNDQKVGPFV